MEGRIVAGVSIAIALFFSVNTFYYRLSEGVWSTLEIIDQLFLKFLDTIFGFLDFIFV